MTFKHKLSARLARLWCGLPLVALLATASCDLKARDGVGPGQPVVLDRVQLSPPVVTVATNAMTEFVAVGMSAAGDTAQSAVSWTVTGGALVQTMNEGGRHIGRYQAGPQAGSYRVIAMVAAGSAQISDTANVIVTTIPVATVVVSPAAVALDVGQTAQLAATLQDANGAALSGRAIAWASGNTAVASVNGSGLVTGVAAGSATITATSEGQNGTTAVTVTALPQPVASVDVTPATASVVLGATVALTATPRDAAGNTLVGRVVTWSSSAPTIASVNGSGVVRGVATGPATITATSEGRNGTSAITVTSAPAPVASVDVTPASAGIQVGQAVQLTATPKDANGAALGGRAVTWASSNPAVATVNSTGLVAGAAVGSATITATSEGQSGNAAIAVTNVPVASVTVTPSSASIQMRGTVQLTGVAKDASGSILSGRLMAWSSSNVQIATVVAGLVTGIAAGTVYIVASSEGTSDTASITVTVPVAWVLVSPASANLPAGATVQLTATPSDSNGNPLSGRTVTWASSNTTVASVNGSGLVTGKVAGSATIRAMSEGQSDSSAITVTSVPVASVTVSPASTNLAAGQAVQLTATARDASGNPLTGRTVTWSSSNPSVAVVYPSGLVTGIAVGSATITATSEGQSGSATITVITGPPPVTVNACPASGYLRLVNVSTQSELTSALGAAQPGDQIRLAAGIYGGASIGRSGTSSDPIVICSNAVGSAILKGLVSSTASYLTIAGLVFEGPSGGNQVYVHACHNVLFTRNEIRFGNHNAGLSVDEVHHMTITYNYIHHNGAGDPSHHHGIYFKTTTGVGNVIANNIIADNVARGLSIHDNTAAGAFDVLVAHNTIVWNGSTGMLANDGDRHIIVNNIFAFNGDANPFKQLRVIPGGGFQGNNTKIWNNLTWSPNASRAGIENTSGAEESGNVIGNPLFVAGLSNLHLLIGSAAIGLGRAGFATLDYDGKPRVLAPAAGAYEFVP